jgi:hypothetical protein
MSLKENGLQALSQTQVRGSFWTTPHPVSVETPCSLSGTDHAKLLDHIHVEPDPPRESFGSASHPDSSFDFFSTLRVPVALDPNRNGNRIFCAVYTMEANHASNVRVMKSTWAKRCNGWVAFSTKTDESIPALEIHHEGPEAYNNMWQKSRSIWKYIAHHYRDEFDWFLIGGDDMYYIVSNLRKYLGSDFSTLLSSLLSDLPCYSLLSLALRQ